MVGMEADDLAAAAFALGMQQGRSVGRRLGRIGEQRGIVVVKNEYAFITRRDVPPGARVPRAEIAGGVIMNVGKARGRVDFALPWSLGAVRRDEDPLASEGIVAAVRELNCCGRHFGSFQNKKPMIAGRNLFLSAVRKSGHRANIYQAVGLSGTGAVARN